MGRGPFFYLLFFCCLGGGVRYRVYLYYPLSFGFRILKRHGVKGFGLIGFRGLGFASWLMGFRGLKKGYRVYRAEGL